MVLSEKDRLILYNQYEILKLLQPEDEHTVNMCEDAQKILSGGFTYNYGELDCMFSEEIPEDECKLVIDILRMFRNLYVSYEGLNAEEKQQLDLEDVTYQGLDGNNETMYKKYADFIIASPEFEEIYKNGRYNDNSHSRKILQYEKMWENYNRILKPHEYRQLSLDEIKTVLKWY